MSEWLAEFLEERFNIDPARTTRVVQLLGVIGAALLFAAVATVIMSFNTFFFDQTIATLEVHDIATRDIFAPISATWESTVLTARGREQAVNNVEDVYDLPDANVARQQTQLARQILDFINNIRRDPYGTIDQEAEDLRLITALDLDEGVRRNILEMDDETWRSVDEQIMDVLERVLQQSIRESDLPSVTSRLPTQVSVRFNIQETSVITAIVGDLIRPNTFVNLEQTEQARQNVSDNFVPVRRTFVAGQQVIERGRPITEADLEALQQLGLLETTPEERRAQLLTAVAQSFMVSIISMVVIGLFIVRFASEVLEQPRFMVLSAAIYLFFLGGVQLIGVDNIEFYLYPTAAMALLFVAILGPHVAIVGTLGLALMVGFMMGQRLDVAAFVGVGGLVGTLSLRRAERLNSYFFAGMMVALVNTVVIVIFNLDAAQQRLFFEQESDLLQLMAFGAANGIFAAAVAMVLMYVVTLLFNLPTGLRLVELSQPNQPLLQRLMREAPGTYQHSLQVANLAEQATSAIGGNAELVRVSALYHDVGKMLNAPFFVENQAGGPNPHDEMNDPYRSAAIIIGHVTEGDKLARQHRIPNRVRDFIREHHGTTRADYFYKQALSQADNPDNVDPRAFQYAGPIPQSRETAILMLADGCESAVRARRPGSRQEIQEVVQFIIDLRTRDGQLDESGLTSNDIKTIRSTFVDMLQAVFHPRINYPSGLGKKASTPSTPQSINTDSKPKPPTKTEKTATGENPVAKETPAPKAKDKAETPPPPPPATTDKDEDIAPLPDVPPLPRRQRDDSSEIDA